MHDQITGFTLDGDYRVDLGPFQQLLFGVGYNHREKVRDDISNDWTNGSGQYGTLYETQGCPVQCTPYTFGSQGFNVISFTSPPNFLKGAGGSFPVGAAETECQPVARVHAESEREAESELLYELALLVPVRLLADAAG